GFDVALAALRRKERATAELAEWLRRRGYGDGEVDATVARLIEAGELDDERFARGYAEDKRSLRGWGSERIREGLAARGIAEGVSGGAWMERAPEEAAEADRGGGGGALPAPRNQPLGEEADRAGARGSLPRRGYGYDVAHEAIRHETKRAA